MKTLNELKIMYKQIKVHRSNIQQIKAIKKELMEDSPEDMRKEIEKDFNGRIWKEEGLIKELKEDMF